ncbi:hypothetical protein K435DRAFT_864539 [Dendrothele bispora CBS 962.96]|uniref:Uncharacterized protein n=1 Tax=Dendrothele bispora (strain CBS 962.96) TaxID=1314807 RepID=A0A4S8LLV7_DENBC|nr:hypothetical protein K435DRAFT_864539 [Dendrothele bispora CBS 962.96]
MSEQRPTDGRRLEDLVLPAFIPHLPFFPSIEIKTVTVQCTASLLAHSVYTVADISLTPQNIVLLCLLIGHLAPRHRLTAIFLDSLLFTLIVKLMSVDGVAAPASGAPIAQSTSISVPAVQHPLPSQTLSDLSQINQPSPAPSFQSPAHSPHSNSAEIAPEVLPVPGNVSELTRKLQSLVDQVRTREFVREFYSPEEGRDYVDQVSRIVLERVKEMRERSRSPIPNQNAAIEEPAWASLHSLLHDANTANWHSSDALHQLLLFLHSVRRYGLIKPELEAIVVKSISSGLRFREALHCTRTSIKTKLKMTAF